MSDLEEYLKSHPNIRLVHFSAHDSNFTGWVDNAEIQYVQNQAHPDGWWSVTTYPAISGLYQGTNFKDALKALEKKSYRSYP